jgi:pimeloyl-ACP methyl ester carboxylesterase
MLIHGREDHNIPIRHSRKITLDHPNLTLWEVPGADHCGAISMAPREFEQRLLQWFERYSPAKVTPHRAEVGVREH